MKFFCRHGVHRKIVREEHIYRRCGLNVYERSERECACGKVTVVEKEAKHEERDCNETKETK